MSGSPTVDTDKVVISLEDVHKAYQMGDEVVHALAGVSFSFRQGSFSAIMGARTLPIAWPHG